MFQKNFKTRLVVNFQIYRKTQKGDDKPKFIRWKIQWKQMRWIHFWLFLCRCSVFTVIFLNFFKAVWTWFGQAFSSFLFIRLFSCTMAWTDLGFDLFWFRDLTSAGLWKHQRDSDSYWFSLVAPDWNFRIFWANQIKTEKGFTMREIITSYRRLFVKTHWEVNNASKLSLLVMPCNELWLLQRVACFETAGTSSKLVFINQLYYW